MIVFTLNLKIDKMLFADGNQNKGYNCRGMLTEREHEHAFWSAGNILYNCILVELSW